MLSRRALLVTQGAAALARGARPPNLVLFLSDDHGCWDSPVYGNPDVRTPNLERIAAAGSIFLNTFSGAAICIPSRAIIASGLQSFRNGAVANGRQMNAGVRTLPTYLKRAGYDVAHFGKTHFLPRENYPDWEWVASETKPGVPFAADLETTAVENWLAARKTPDRPVCMIVCCHSPHVTWEENNGYDPDKVTLPASFIDTPETRKARTRYYTDITKMDTQLGDVYDSVRRHLGGNTLFLATSDNGAQWPFGKWTLYDAGIRMPLAAVWPGVVKAGARPQAMLHFTDILPTFCELAGAKPPEGIDGRSFAAVLRGRANKHRTEIYASHTADNNGQMNCYPMRCVRDARFKYIRNLRPDLVYTTHIDRGVARDGRLYWDEWKARAQSDPRAAEVIRRYHQRPAEELYDLRSDPHETRNLAADPRHGRILGSMRAKLDAWMKSMNDPGETWGTPRLISDHRHLLPGG